MYTTAPKAVMMMESTRPMYFRPMAMKSTMLAQQITMAAVPAPTMETMMLALRKPAAMSSPPKSTFPPSARIWFRMLVTSGKFSRRAAMMPKRPSDPGGASAICIAEDLATCAVHPKSRRPGERRIKRTTECSAPDLPMSRAPTGAGSEAS